MEVVKSYRLLILKLMLLGQIILLFSLVYRATGDGKYYPAHDDEIINYCSAILFDETGSVRAQGSINEDVSSIGQLNWYGPGYAAFYGSMRRVFGEAPYLFIWIHFVLALVTLGLIYFLPGPSESKLLMANSLVFTWQYSAYIFTYFPESLNLFMALLLILLLFKINEQDDPGRRMKFVFIYLGMVMIFILCRVTFVFWLTALVGISRSRREAIRMIFLFGVSLGVVLVYMKYFTAPPYAAQMQKINELYQFNILEFFLKTLSSLWINSWNLLYSGSLEVYFLLALAFVAAIRWWKTKERILLAVLLVTLTFISALMAYYYPGHYFFIKQSDVLIPLLLAALMFSKSPTALKINNAVVGASLIIFIISFNRIWGDIQVRRAAFVGFTDISTVYASFQVMRNYIDEEYPVTVLWCYNEFPYGSTTETLLPFSTKNREPILYTSNIVDPSAAPEIKFKRHGKLLYMLLFR